jgi:hypothetical protein
MTYDNDDRTKPVRQPNPRTYHSPSLLVYGAIREITASGSGSKTENKGADNQPTKRP